MKKAIGYVRVSTEDQSNFSPDGQEEMIRAHCTKQGIELIEVFRDEGYTAWNFDRPDWQRLHEFVKRHYLSIDELIVVKFDRFSRRAHMALSMLEKLEDSYSIIVTSVLEPIGLHKKSPYYFKIRADIITGAQVELMMIRDRTKFGIVSGASQGRFLNRAPLGYVNARDANNKPIIEIDPLKADIVKEVFNKFLMGTPIEVIRKSITRHLFRGNSAIQHLLQNPAYMGYVKKPAYYDEPEKLVKGLHQPLIDEATWYEVQAIFNKKSHPSRIILNPEVPLRGLLKCECGKSLTAGASRNRHGKRYWYYQCHGHRGSNFAAGKLHAQFTALLEALSLPKFHVDYLRNKIVLVLKERLESRENELQQCREDLSKVKSKIDSLEEKYISGLIDQAMYTKWKGRFTLEEKTIQSRLSSMIVSTDHTFDKEGLSILSDLSFLYNAASLEKKQAFVRIVFNSQLSYQGGMYRTPYLLPVFHFKALELKEKGLLEFQQPGDISANLQDVPRSGTLSNLETLLYWAKSA